MMNYRRRTYRLTVGLLICLSVLFSSAFATALAESCSHTDNKATCNICMFEPYEVRTHHPDQVRLNLFDYWLTPSRTNADGSFVDDTQNNSEMTGTNSGRKAGINKNGEDGTHILHFRNGSYTDVEWEDQSVSFNASTTQPSVPSGFVKNTLVNDYPVAKSKTGNLEENLAYLFDPAVIHDGKQSFSDVRGLFQLDSEGYYYYNSMQEGIKNLSSSMDYSDDVEFQRYGGAYEDANYAYFDEKENRFRIYNDWGVYLNKRGTNYKTTFNMNGQFFPFDPPSDAFTISNNKLVQKDINCAGSTFNHYMGFTLEVPFVQSTDGQIEYKGEIQDTIFYFSGDDDMWLFIDGVLVGDLGGIHDAFTMNVNFHTGEVKLNEKHTEYEVTDNPDTDINEKEAAEQRTQTTLRALFERAGKDLDTYFEPNSNTFKDGSEHEIKMFYMERGHNASNLGIKFNLKTVPSSSIHKQDQDGKELAGAEFTLYPADKLSNGAYVIKENAEAIFTGTTDTDGKLILENKGDTIQISELPGEHFILRETTTPQGYRSVGDMHLMKYPLLDRSVALLSDPDSPTGSKWSSGSYGAAKLTTIATAEVFRRDGVQIVNTQQNMPLGGTMFAVVLKRVDFSADANLKDHRSWRPVYGDAETGYHLVPVKNPDDTAQYNAAIKIAVENNPYAFELKQDNPSRYVVNIDSLPGDILHYYNANSNTADNSQVQYAVFYGWTSATDLNNIPDDAQFIRINSDNFERIFTTNFMALNVKETFNVKKTDERGDPLEGVEFTLYDAEMNLLEFASTDENGMISFPNNEDVHLVVGNHYYLKETSVPAGYEMRDVKIHVYVDDTGVYVDAGEKGDGVTVQRGVGRIVDTMHEFGVNDDLDVTLHNIFYEPYITTDDPDTDGFENANWKKQSGQYHLHHKTHSVLEHPEHGFEPAPHSGISDAHFINDEGWSHISIYQCQEDCCAEINSFPYPHKEDLSGRNITNLFTRGVTVVVSNQNKRAEVDVKGFKTMSGRDLRNGEFTFKITPVGDAPKPAEPFAVNKADGSITFAPLVFLFGDHEQEDTDDTTDSSAGNTTDSSAASEPMEYTYRIEEVIGSDPAVVYDPTYWLVKIKVSYDAAANKMNAELLSYEHYDQSGNLISQPGAFTAASFANSLIPPGTGDDSTLLLWSAALVACMGCVLLMRRRCKN